MKLIDGKKYADIIIQDLDKKLKKLNKQNIELTLAIILVGDDASSQIYVRNKVRKCKEINIKAITYELPATIKEEKLIALINKLNSDPKINGILLQSPLPKHLNYRKMMGYIDYRKDVDGFSYENLGALMTNNEYVVAATPKGIIKLLELENIDVAGKNVVIIGRSNIVGRPLAMALLNKDATVTITHSKTKNLKEITKTADILIVAIGEKEFITGDYIKDKAIIIDVGINRVDGKIVGDVLESSVKDKASLLTPVPGGVGPMTIAMLLSNLVFLSENNKEKDNG